jgi:Ketopantoate hydroxymethyltransferase
VTQTSTAAGSSALPTLAAARARGTPIVMLTAYDHPSGRVAVEAGVDVVLVGDSAAMTVLGYSSTRDISVDELLILTRAVRRAVTGIPVVGDLPFGSYEESDSGAVATARRFVDEAGCDAVKLEGAGEMLSRVAAIIGAGIPVIGHVGLLPQSVDDRRRLSRPWPRRGAGVGDHR